MRYVCQAAVVALSILAPSVVFGQGTQGLSITNYQFVSEQRISLSQSDVTYRATLVNTGGVRSAVTATVTSLVPSVQVVQGQGNLHFSPVPANSQVASNDTFTILVDRSVPFDFSNLQWTFNAPVANAGPNQTVAVGSTVTLNGSGSTNPTGIGTLTYSWKFASRPPGTFAGLKFNDSVSPTFVADVAGDFVITLTVSNGVGTDSANVIVSTNNSPPVANAGPDQTVALGSTVFLNGSGSTDVDGDPLTYSWTMIQQPAGSTATLSGANTIAPSFVVDKPGKYVVQLIVNDGFVNSPAVTVNITTQNSPPVANPGPNQSVNVGALVQLNGANSTDVDGDPLTYKWSLQKVPVNSTATLSSLTAVNPTFTADLPGTYIAQLIVNDGKVDSNAATVTISTNAVQAPTANAGPDQTVKHGATVTLQGSGTDPQGLTLTYSWSLTGKPLNSTAKLSSTTLANPTFVADLPGDYAAQLIVNDGFNSSAPATVKITTTNTAPVANAGSNTTITVGNNVLLDGSGSSDADNDPLTYSWSLTKPQGSNAVLNGASTAHPIFQADVPGVYVAQLIVSDPYTSSTPATVQITAVAVPTITLTPNPLNLTNVAGTLTITLSAAPGQFGQVISLLSTNQGVATVPATVTVPSGSTGVNVAVTPTGVGNTTITASASGYLGGSSTVNVVAPAITLTLDSSNLGLTRTINGTVTLNSPAPGGGVVVALAANPTGIVTLQPANVTIAGGATSGTFTVTGANIGQTTITGTLSGYASGTANVNVGNLGLITLPVNLSIGTGPAVSYPVTLATNAPAGGVTVTLTSNDPNTVTISPSTVTIPAGANVPPIQPKVTGVNFGSTTIIASAPGFQGDTETVKVAGTLLFAPNTLTMTTGSVQNLNLTLTSPAPANGLTINLSSDNTGIATVPATINFPAGATSVSVPVTGGTTSGSSIIHASLLPNLADTTANVTVAVVGNLSIPVNATVGLTSSASFPVTLSTASPAGGTTVTLVSSDPSKLTISPSTVTIAAGAMTPTVQPQITGVNFGTATITATAPGYTTASQPVKVIASASFSPGTVTITGTGTQNVTLTLSAPAPAGGVVFNLSSDATSTATVPATVTIAAGNTSAPVTITGVSVGSTVIHAVSSPNVADTTVNVNIVSSGPISLPANVTVGPTQSANFQVTLPSAAPAGGVTVTLGSSDTSKVTVTSSVTIPAGATSPVTPPQVTGVNFGSATITASSPGFTSGTQTVQVGASISFNPNSTTIAGTNTTNLTLNLSTPAPAGGLLINLSSNNTAAATVPSTVTIAANANSVQVPVTGVAIGTATITASTSAPNVASTTASITVISPGTVILPAGVVVGLGKTASFPVTLPTAAPAGGITVTLGSSDTSKVTISPATVTIAAGQTAPPVQPTITGVNLGAANITASAPGYTSGTQSVQVNATAAFSPNTLTITGAGTQNLTLTLSAAAPAGGVIINLSSDNTSIATVPATVTFAPGTSSVPVPVTAVAVGTANIHASSVPFIGDTTAAVTVASQISLPSGVTVTPGQQAGFTITLASPAPSGGVFISLTSSDPSKVTVSPANILIPQGQSSVTTPKVTGVNFGSATITASAFNYLSATSTVVTSGTLTLAPATLQITGVTTQSLTVTLSGSAPAGGLVINLSSSNTAVATVPATVTIPANSSSVNVPVTSVAPGTTTIHASELPVLADTTATVTVVAAGSVVLPNFASVGQFSSAPLTVSLSSPAPTGGVTITLTSSDPTILTITPSTVTVPAGATTPTTTPQVNGINLGFSDVTASAPGYLSATLKNVYVSDSIHLALPTTVAVGMGQSVPVQVNLSNPAATGGVTITLTSDNPAIASITPSVFVPAGLTTPTTQPVVTGVNVGTTGLHAAAPGYSGNGPSTVTVSASVAFTPTTLTISGSATQNLTLTLSANAPAGGVTINLSSSNTAAATVPATVTFAAGQNTVQVPVTGVAAGSATIHANGNNIGDTTAAITVTSTGAITVPANTNLNLGQTATLNVSLSAAPASPVTIALASSDTSKATVSPATVTIAAGATTPATQPTVTGVNVGAANITASSTGYSSGVSAVKVSATATISPNPIAIGGIGSTSPATLTLSANAPAGGLTVNLSSDNTAIATVPATATFTAGNSTVQVNVTGVAAGSTTIHVSGTNIPDSTATVNVSNTASIILPANISTGPGTQVAFPVTLSSPAPPGGVVISLSSSNTGVLTISPATVTIPAGGTNASPTAQVTGVAFGTANVIASATGYTTVSQAVTVGGSLTFIPNSISFLSGVQQNIVLSLNAPTSTALTINLSSSNTAVATVPATATIQANGQAVNVKITGVSGGTATITASLTGVTSGTAAVTIVPPLGITTSSLPSAQINIAYSQALTAQGGATPYSWSITSGTLPTGLTLNSSTGVISGTPTVLANATPLTFKVTDSSSPAQSATANLTLTVSTAPLSIGTTSLANGTVGTAYSQSLAVTGGTTPYSWSLVSGTLPTGLSLSTAGVISGTPQTIVSATPLQFKVTDGATPTPQTATVSLTLTIVPSQLTVSTTGALPAGQMTVPYSTTLVATGGATPYSWQLTGGSMPAGLTLNSSTGVISGTPQGPVVTNTPLTFTVTDSTTPTHQTASTVNVTLSITAAPLVITTPAGALPDSQMTVAYSTTLAATGGTTPYTWSLTSGTLPTGLTLNTSTGAITGTPSGPAVTNTPLTFKVTDNAAKTASVNVTLTVKPSPLVITSQTLQNGQLQQSYNQSLAATGGTAPYTWSLTSGPLPTGLSLNSSTGAITGTPTGTAQGYPLTFKVTDGATPTPQTATVSLTLTIAPAQLSILSSSLPNGQVGVAYSQALSASGGVLPYTWQLTSANMPAGLTLNSSTGVISGTPQGPAVNNLQLSFKVTDSATPTAATATATLGLTIAPTALNISTTGALPNGQITVNYSTTLAVTGGTAPYTWVLTSGTMPPGLALHATTGVISGTPQGPVVTNTPLTFTVTDSSPTPQSKPTNVTLTILASPLSTTTTALPNAQQGIAYSQQLSATGGTTPYSWQVASGVLPTGLTLTSSTGVISGTPTGTATGVQLTFKVTDSSSPVQNATTPVISLTVTPPQLTIQTVSLPNGKVGVAYSQTVSATGGVTPYTWSLNTGTLPAGLNLNTSTGVISGTPTTASGNISFQLKVTDATTAVATQFFAVSIAPPDLVIGTPAGALPNAQTGSAYSFTLTASGGTPSYTWSQTGGIMPAGLALNSSTGVISGTPQGPAVNNTPLTFKVTDSGTPTPQAQAVNVTLTVQPTALVISTTSLASGQVNVAYTQSLVATGGTAPYTWQLTSGTMPPGLSLNSTTGVISGTPQGPAVNSTPLTFKVTDSSPTPQTLSTNGLTLTIAPTPLTGLTSALANGRVGTAYSQTLTVTGGTAPYTWQTVSGTLPTGLALNSTTGVISGTPQGPAVTGLALQFKVTDSSPTPQSASTSGLTLTIAPSTLVFSTTSLANGTAQTAYSATLSASGGTPAYTWALTGGTMPTGLSLNSTTGVISGTPQSGVSNAQLTFTVTDSGTPTAQTASKTLSLTIAPATLTITTTTLPNGTKGVAYSQTLAASGGTPAFTWSVASGSLPTGLTLNSSTGVVSGTPSGVPGPSTVAFKVVDSGTPTPQTATSVGITITINAPPLTITTTSLASGTQGNLYTQSLAATGGTTPYTWSLTSGTLPTGLSLNTSTGLISGVPSAPANNISLTFTVKDNSSPQQTQSATFSLTIAPPPVLITTTGLPGGSLTTPYFKQMTATGGTAPYTWQLTGGSLPPGININSAGQITGTPTATGTFNGIVIKVTDSSTPALTASSTFNNVVISGVPTGPALTVTSVNVGNGLEAPISVSIPSANTFNLTVTLTVSDFSKALLSTSPTGAGSPSITVQLNAGITQVGLIYVQGLASSGSTTIVASAPNYSDAVATVGLFPSGFMLTGPTGGNNFTTSQGVSSNITLTSIRLDQSLNFVEGQLIAGGTTASVNVTSSNQNVGTVSPSPVTLAGGLGSVTAQFNAANSGASNQTTTLLTATAPAGFSTPGGGVNQVTAFVSAPAINPVAISVGNGLENTTFANLSGATTQTNVIFTISTTDPKISFSTDGVSAGQKTITVNTGNHVGVIRTPSFFVYGLASSGTATYTVSGGGFPTGTGTVTLTPSSIVIQGPFGLGNNFITTTGAGAIGLQVFSAQLDASNTYIGPQAVAGGSSVSAAMTVSPALGTIQTPAVIAPGANSVVVNFTPSANGTAQISVVQPSGFVNHAFSSESVTISTPNIKLTDSGTVGQHLQGQGSIILGQSPMTDLIVTLTSTDPSQLLLSPNSTTAGQPSIQITIPAGTTFMNYYVQGVGNSGTGTYTANATGFNQATSTVSLAPSGIVIVGASGVNSTFNSAYNVSLTSGPATSIPVVTCILNSNGGYLVNQQLAGGLSLHINLISSATNVGTVPSPVTLTGGTDNVQVPFTPVAQGSTTVFLLPDPTYTVSSDNNFVTVNVTP